MAISPNICVTINLGDNHRLEKAEFLAQELNLPLVKESAESNYQYHLVYTDYCLMLQQNPRVAQFKISPIFVEFLQQNRVHPKISSSSLRDPLAKAIGLKPNIRPTVFDATAGLGVDAMRLAHMGCKVILAERSPIIHALLQDGLNRASTHGNLNSIISDNITLLAGDSITLLAEMDDSPASVLLDPMYPPTRKSALHKKEMRFLRDIVGSDDDGKDLFSAALRATTSRVVVKRPKGAGYIITVPEPNTQIQMKSGRFDVYLKNHL